MLSSDDFKELIRNGPLISFDLIIRNNAGEVLIGYRNNAPAKEYWFVPGGRILKDETLNAALQRVSHEEIKFKLTEDQCRQKGIYEHIYEENYFEESEFGTHYVVIALEHTDSVDQIEVPNGDAFHRSFKYETVENILTSDDVHQFTKNYFMDAPNNLFMSQNELNR